jgi:hypothetical protein
MDGPGTFRPAGIWTRNLRNTNQTDCLLGLTFQKGTDKGVKRVQVPLLFCISIVPLCTATRTYRQSENNEIIMKLCLAAAEWRELHDKEVKNSCGQYGAASSFNVIGMGM